MRLPVTAARLRAEFPALTDEDVAAYQEVTGRLVASPRDRGRLLAEVLAAAARAREKETASSPLTEEERLALAYFRALEKTQGRKAGGRS
jgi:hypothetical protein